MFKVYFMMRDYFERPGCEHVIYFWVCLATYVSPIYAYRLSTLLF